MNAVVNASATAAGASLGPGRGPSAAVAPGCRRPRQRHPRREPPADRGARPRIQDVVALPDAGRAERGLAHREPAEDPRGLARIAQGQRPAVGGRRRLQGDGGAEAAVHEGALEAPLLEQLRDQVHRVALADAAQIEPNAIGRRADLERIRVDLERRQPGPDRDVERAAGQVVDVPRDQEAFERGLADARALARRQVIEPGDVAVRPEAAQLALEAIHEGEGRLGGLRGVACVGVRDVDLEHRVHGLVREAPKTGLAVTREPDPAVEIHVEPTSRASSPAGTRAG